MTVLGKILAFVNLLFSLAVGALIVFAFVARTNWHDAFEQQKKETILANTTVSTLQKDWEKTQGELKSSQESEQTVKRQAGVREGDLNQRIKQLDDSLAAERAKVQNVNNALNSNVIELQSRQREVENLKLLMAQRDELMKQKEAQNEQAKNLQTQYEIERNAEHERNVNLLAQLEKLSKDLQKAQQNGGGTGSSAVAARKNPPAEDIEGLVKATDPQSGLLTLTIGSDAGLAKGNTLEVYRLKPEPAYLGTIEVLMVRHDQAVAKPLTRLKGQIQVGDTVASNINGRR
jgi:hypothetical protein